MNSVENMILNILAILIIVIFVGSIYAFVRSILLFIFSNGEAESRKKARNWIRFMVIGIMLTVALLFVFPILFKYMGVQGYEVFTAENIFNRVGELLQGILNIGKEVRDQGYSNNAPAYESIDNGSTIDASEYSL